MMLRKLLLAATAISLAGSPVLAQSQLPVVKDSTGRNVQASGVLTVDLTGTYVAPASAANQAAQTAAINSMSAAQGASTAGQTEQLVACSVTTAAPTYTTAQTWPLNCDTFGGQRTRLTFAGVDAIAYPNIPTSGAGVGAWGLVGRYQASPTSLTDGQYGAVQINPRGGVHLSFAGSMANNAQPQATGVYDQTGSQRPLGTAFFGFNGTTNDACRTVQGSEGTGLGICANAPAPHSSAAGAIVPSFSPSAAATSLILKAGAGNYYDGYCKSSVVGNCIAYNSTTVPSAGALTASLVLECAPILTAGGVASWSYGTMPRRATVGIVYLFSSSTDCNTYTASATAYIHGSVQ